MGKFTGVWAVFENLDETTETIEEVCGRGTRPTVLSPSPRHEIDHARSNSRAKDIGCIVGAKCPAEK